MKLKSYVQGQWQEGEGTGQILKNAVTGEVVAEVKACVVVIVDHLDAVIRPLTASAVIY